MHKIYFVFAGNSNITGRAKEFYLECLSNAGIGESEYEFIPVTISNNKSVDTIDSIQSFIDRLKDREVFSIVLMGKLGLQLVTGRPRHDLWIGMRIVWRPLKCYAYPCFEYGDCFTNDGKLIYRADLIRNCFERVGRDYRDGVTPCFNTYDTGSVSKQHVEQFLQELMSERAVAVDLETTGLDTFKNKIIGISFAKSSMMTKGVFIEWAYLERSKLFKDFLMSDVCKVMHNSAFDVIFLLRKGYPSNYVMDTLAMHHVLDERKDVSGGLKDLVLRYLDFGEYGVGSKQFFSTVDWLENMVDLSSFVEYACLDAIATIMLFFIFLKQSVKEELYHEVLVVSLSRSVLNYMSFEGIGVDLNYVNKVESKIDDEVKELKEQLFTEIGYTINVSSSSAIVKLLNKYNIRVDTKTAKGNISVKNEVLHSLLKENPTFIFLGILVKIRDLLFIKSGILTQVKNLEVNDRVYPDYNISGTVTGRVSARKPGIHNIMSDKSIKRVFVPADEHIFITADFVGAELRVLANYSQEENYIKTFKEGGDIHTSTHIGIFGGEVDKVSGAERKVAKFANFCIVYGGGASRLSILTGKPKKECKKFIDKYFDNYKGVRKFIDDAHKEVLNKGFAVSKYFKGRRRFPEIRFLKDRRMAELVIKKKSLRQSVNYLIQHDAAFYTYVALCRLSFAFKRLGWGRCVLTVHDSIICEVPLQYREFSIGLMKDIMCKPMGWFGLSTEHVNMDVDPCSEMFWGEYSVDKDSKYSF